MIPRTSANASKMRDLAARLLAELVNERFNVPRNAHYLAAVILADDPDDVDSVKAELARADAARFEKSAKKSTTS